MNTCKTCRWWDLSSTVADRPSVHHCGNPKIEADEGTDPDDCMFPQSPGTFTGQDFGCIHHEDSVIRVEIRKRTAEEFRRVMHKQIEDDPEGLFSDIVKACGGWDKFSAEWADVMKEHGINLPEKSNEPT